MRGNLSSGSTVHGKGKVVVAMSGGVDSSVAAALLKDQGYEVLGVTMQLWDKGREEAAETGAHRPCCTLDDVMDAARVAERLGIPFEVLNLEEEFQRQVVDPFVADYRSGMTPNPCILCNERIKFQALLDRSIALGADFLATGHYVRREETPGGLVNLKAAIDRSKDQSYFLFTVTQPQLRRLLFPLGSLRKQEVRRLAEAFRLPVAAKSESQEICFVTDNDYAAFVERRAGGSRVGAIVDKRGRVLGEHGGIHRYTIGQRRGLGIPAAVPLYVTGINPDTREVMIGQENELYSHGLEASGVNWIVPPPAPEFSATCKIRYRQEPLPCEVSVLDEGRMKIGFMQPLRAVTPGQAVVLYDGDIMLGGGWIERKSTYWTNRSENEEQ
jgi:tRNA-specific 2-thiouridylase